MFVSTTVAEKYSTLWINIVHQYPKQHLVSHYSLICLLFKKSHVTNSALVQNSITDQKRIFVIDCRDAKRQPNLMIKVPFFGKKKKKVKNWLNL